MGFSLENFFENLEDIINDTCTSQAMKYSLLIEEIKEAKQYAKDCGQLNG